MSSGTGPVMMGVLLVDLGLALGAAGILCLLRPMRWLLLSTRRRALAAIAVAASAGITGVALPAPDQRTDERTTSTRQALDHYAPRWQFSERHERLIHASPARVMSAVHAVTAGEIRLFRILTWLRHPHLPGRMPPNILAAPADTSLIDVALGSGFFLLAEEPEREIVIGSLVVVPDALRRLPREELARQRDAFTSEDYRELSSPGYAKASMNFAVTALAGGETLLTTETRVEATDDATRRRFAAYWRLIYPGSALIRINWLEAIRRRAESMPPTASP